MAIDPLTAITPNDLSAFPDNAAINATSPSATDGTPLTAIGMNNYWHGRQQALLNYAGLTPTGVVESDTVSQELEAFQKGFGVGPGIGVTWWLNDDPSVTGHRVLLLIGQGILIASYVDLDAALYVGDGNNAAVAAGGGAYYRSSDAGGATPNIAGPYLQLPDTRGYAPRGLDLAAAVDPDGASRFLGDIQADAFQGWQLGATEDASGVRDYWAAAESRDFNNTAGASANYSNMTNKTTDQGLARMLKAVDDGTNGPPRTGLETVGKNFSTQFGITY